MRHLWWAGAMVLVLGLATASTAQENVLVLYGSPDRDWVAAVAAKLERQQGPDHDRRRTGEGRADLDSRHEKGWSFKRSDNRAGAGKSDSH